MAQQVNLAAPIFLKEKHYLSAKSLGIALLVLLISALVFCAFWVETIQQSAVTLRQLAERNQHEIETRKAALQAAKLNRGPADAALKQQLIDTEKLIQLRELQWAELQRGLFRPGFGHSARLQLIAQTVPSQAWVTEVKADETRFTLTGFTLEPAALNEWVAKLSASPLLSSQQLTTVKVERVLSAAPQNLLATNPVPPAPAARVLPPAWSFTLVSAVVNPLNSMNAGRP